MPHVRARVAALFVLAALSAAPVVAAAQSPNAEMPFAFDGPPAPVAPEVVARAADGRATVRAVRLAAPLRIDGALDEALYNGPSVSGFVQVEPTLGAAATERTEVWVAFDRTTSTFRSDAGRARPSGAWRPRCAATQ